MVVGLAACSGSTITGVERAYDSGGANNGTGGISGSGSALGRGGSESGGGGGDFGGSGGNVFGGSGGRVGSGGRIVGTGGGIGAQGGVGGSGGIGTGGGMATGGAAGACNTLENVAPAIKTVVASGSVPPALGGTVVSGTYYMTSWIGYGTEADCRSGLSVTDAQAVMVVDALTSTTGTIEEITALTMSGGFGTITERITAEYVTSGTTITTTVTCSTGTGTVRGGTHPYTATPSEIQAPSMENTTCPSIATVTKQ